MLCFVDVGMKLCAQDRDCDLEEFAGGLWEFAGDLGKFAVVSLDGAGAG